MAQYNHTTFTEAKTALGLRLGDPDHVFWPSEELGFYLRDALRHWGLVAQYWKATDTFVTSSAQPFYTLSSSTTLRSYTCTDTELIKLVQNHLMEPATGTSWTGTEQFSYPMVLDAIERSRNRLLLETGAVLQVDEVNTGSPPVSGIPLDSDIIDVRRVAWKSPAGTYRNLRRHGQISRRSFNPTASFTPGTTTSYLLADQPYVSLQLSPPSIDAGQLQLITSRSIGNPTGQGVVLGIPDEFVPTLKWGVLADLLSSEKAQDPARTEYCLTRWKEGLDAARLATSVWAMEVNGRPVSISSLAEKDAFSPNWQNTTGTPTSVATAGLDLIALSPVPDGVYSVTTTLTRSPLLPTLDTDYLQVGRELMDVLMDYCVHLACFKQGGDMFAQTQGQLRNFLEAAKLQNARLRAQDNYATTASDQASREERFRSSRMAYGV